MKLISNENFNINFNEFINMDLRGIAHINDSVKYLIGGMGKNQIVTNKVFKLEWKTSKITKIKK